MGIGDSGGWGKHESRPPPKIMPRPERRLVEMVLDGSADRVLVPTEEKGKYELWERVSSRGETIMGSYKIPGTYRLFGDQYIRR